MSRLVYFLRPFVQKIICPAILVTQPFGGLKLLAHVSPQEEEEDQEELEDATYQGEETSNPSQPSIDKDLLKSIKWPSDVSKTNLRSFMASVSYTTLTTYIPP